AVVQENTGKLILTIGEANIEAISKKSYSIYSQFLNDPAYGSCMQLKYFLDNKKPNYYRDPLRINAFLIWHLLFITLGWFFTLTLKHSNWQNLGYTIVYWLLQILLIMFCADIFSRSDTFGIGAKLGLGRILQWFDLSRLRFSDSEIEKTYVGIF